MERLEFNEHEAVAVQILVDYAKLHYKPCARWTWFGKITHIDANGFPRSYNNEERIVIGRLVGIAAKHCGGGEDTIGAILYTGAKRASKLTDKEAVALATKLDGRDLTSDEILPEGLQHNKAFGVYHWDTFDNETILIGEADTLHEAQEIVDEKYLDRFSIHGADQVDIVNSKGEIVQKFKVC